MKKFELGIVIPTYNEKDNIVELIELIHSHCTESKIATRILVMDDNSPDGTADIVREVAKGVNNDKFLVDVHVRPRKMGLASAYTQGFSKIKDEVENLLSMDADLSHQPKYIKDFVAQMRTGSYDYIIGSRYVKGGGVQDWGAIRRFISKMGSTYSRFILGVKIYDFTGGYNLYKSSIFDSFDINSVKAQGYLFQIEMKYSLAKKGFKFVEVPIIFPDRTKGVSKISKKIIIEAFLGVVGLRFRK